MPKKIKNLAEWKKRSAGQKRRWGKVPFREKQRIMAALSKKSVQKSTFEERSKRIKAGKYAMSKAKMGRAAKKGARTRAGRLTMEQRTAIGKMLGKARMKKLSKEERKELAGKAAKAFWQSRSLEEISRIQKRRGIKSGKKRRQKKFGNLAYVEKLPSVRRWRKKDMEKMLKRFEKLINGFVQKYENNYYFEEIRSEIYFGFVVALSKWNGKIKLGKLIEDSISLGLIRYFSRLKGFKAIERDIENNGAF